MKPSYQLLYPAKLALIDHKPPTYAPNLGRRIVEKN